MARLSANTLRKILIGLAVAAGLYQLAFLSDMASRLYGRSIVREPFFFSQLPPAVEWQRPEAEAAGLRPKDRITAIDGQPVTGTLTLSRRLARAKPGESLPLRWTTPTGEERTGAIGLLGRQSNSSQISAGVTHIFLPIFCLTLGFAVAFIRPTDHRSWILLGLMLSFPGMFISTVDIGRWSLPFYALGLIFRVWLPMTWGIWMMALGLEFPRRLTVYPGLRLVALALAIPIGLGSLIRALFEYARNADLPLAASLLSAHALAAPVSFYLTMGAIGLFFACLGMQYGTAPDPDAKRRARLLQLGSHVAFLPMFLVLLSALIRRVDFFEAAPFPIIVFALLMLTLFPLTLAYVIIVEKALDVRVVLRLGLQYALAKNAILGLSTAIAAAVALYALYAVDTDRDRTTPLLILILAIAFIAALVPLTRRLQTWVDRRFFREAYDTEQILTDLAEQVRTIVEVGPLLETVGHRLSQALHIPRLAILLKQPAGFQPAFALGYPPEIIAERLPAIDPEHTDPKTLARTSGWNQIDNHLLLPLRAKDGVLAILSLGPKRSEEPYSPSDLRLLRSVAAQTGLALENTRLTAAVAHELAQREQYDREMAIAREVQQRLFPSKVPQLRNVDCAGGCRPAQSVGGDYYDFMTLPDNEMAFAVGDVSGKGMPAALLMAALQASVRGQTMNHITDLAVFSHNVNILLYDMSPKSHFATLFYATYDPVLRKLRYANAGHNPPILVRANGPLDFLKTSGPGLGMTKLAKYTPEEVTLRQGDMVIAYTDGITEAMNRQRDDFGELRLIETVRATRDLSAGETIRRVMAAVDAFADGAPQHDDMTMVVLKVQ